MLRQENVLGMRGWQQPSGIMFPKSTEFYNGITQMNVNGLSEEFVVNRRFLMAQSERSAGR
jgi:hypothetical protein